MLPFDRKPWAKHVAATVIVVTIIAAICVPIILHYRKALDVPIVVGIVLLLLAIIPPNIVILRRRPGSDDQLQPTPPRRPHLYAPR
jgi:predicted ABC-type exoprotein transport system permease subunit